MQKLFTDFRQLRNLSAHLFVIMGLVLSSSFAASPARAAQEPAQNRVLIIYSSSDIGEWEQIYNSQILSELAIGYQFEVIPEFLSLIEASAERQELFAQSLLMKYGAPSFDLVIAVSAEAGSFVRQWSPVFSPGSSRLYMRPGNDILSAQSLPASDYILKSAVETAASKTLDLMVTLLPELTNVYVVGGAGEADLSYAQSIRNAATSINTDVELEFIQGLLATELPEALRDIPPTSAIIIATYDANRLGQPERLATVTGLLRDSLDIPIFALFDTQIGRGAIGGNVSTTVLYARGTADLARQILAGNATEQINTAPTRYIFDGSRLDTFDLDRNLLPAGSTITNEAPDFVGQNLTWIITVFVVIVVQLAFIALLLRAVNQRRKAEEVLKASQKMEALGNLAGGIAHDFNNVLMAIMANAELAKMSVNDSGSVDKRLTKIISASNRAKGLISQILMFSRQAASQTFTTAQPNSMLAESIEEISSVLPSTCTIKLHCEPDLPSVVVDTNQLHQAITNICINAQHAMSNEGEIHIHTSNLVTNKELELFNQALPPGNYLAIAISDTGVGIHEENARHVFEPFFTTKLQGKGTGLGLTLAYRIIRAHNGYIDLQSKPGKGSTFTIYLQASDSSAVKQQQTRESKLRTGNGESILLVDDDDMVLDTTCRTLEKLNYTVYAFRSSLKALEAFKAKPEKWNLIFTDLSMPEMDGVRLSVQARQIRDDIQIIIYTGYLDAVDSIDLKNLHILSKPSRIDDIANTVATALREAG